MTLPTGGGAKRGGSGLRYCFCRGGGGVLGVGLEVGFVVGRCVDADASGRVGGFELGYFVSVRIEYVSCSLVVRGV